MAEQRETEAIYERRGGILIVKLHGAIELFDVERLKSGIVSAIETEGVDDIVFSLGDVPLIDSTGLGLFIGLRLKYRGQKRFRFCELYPAVRAVFKYARLFSYFEIDATLEESLAALEGRQ